MPNKNNDNSEIVHEGWLTKSPPTNRIWRARWRKRWFVLRHSGELPDQYFLCYYTDKNCRTLKGTIDLDQCEQVDAGLQFENSKHKYRHMFDVRTPKRTYYLAAETEADMNNWVDCVCHVCGLKAYNQEENMYGYGEETTSLAEEIQNTESPPVSPSSTASGPYIPISECITGKPMCQPNNFQDEFYDSPRRLQPPGNLDLRVSMSMTPPLQSPGTDAESVFTDEEWSNTKPTVNWDTFPQPSDSLEDIKPALISSRRRYTKPVAPPRPPKPQHLVLQDSTDMHTYSNLDDQSPAETNQSSENISNDTYDFPRSHQLNNEQENIDPVPVPRSRNCYTNTAQAQGGTVFLYDFPPDYTGDEPVSPFDASPSAHCSNASSLVYSSPPAVNRGLKPGRRASDSVSNEPSPQHPNIDLNHLRHLKPSSSSSNKSKDDHHVPLTLCAPPRRNEYNTHSLRYTQSPTATNFNDNDHETKNDESFQTSRESTRFPFSHRASSKKKEIQYLDLDLDSNENGGNSTTAESSITVYREVDFVKTEAFNRTRQRVEEERKQCPEQ